MTVEDYLKPLSEERRSAINKLRKTLKDNLPAGFQEAISYGMISYVVPLSIYPAGYNCDPQQPLPFISIASQKGHIAIYHMGLYADKLMLEWFTEKFTMEYRKKPDMGKSCIRFKDPEKIPFGLIAELAAKMSAEQWIKKYETSFIKK